MREGRARGWISWLVSCGLACRGVERTEVVVVSFDGEASRASALCLCWRVGFPLPDEAFFFFRFDLCDGHACFAVGILGSCHVEDTDICFCTYLASERIQWADHSCIKYNTTGN